MLTVSEKTLGEIKEPGVVSCESVPPIVISTDVDDDVAVSTGRRYGNYR
jgi:hypothetical protein